jgi:hypothetical protein
MDTVQATSRVTAATNADARPLVAAQRRRHDEEQRATPPNGEGQHGGVRRAVVEALKASGVDLPTSRLTEPTETPDDSPVAATAALREDLHGFMHELHEAVKSAGRPDSEETDAENGNGRRSFADGMGALVSEVTAGDTPAGLQSAFDRILGDVGGSGNAATLLGFLSKLQALLGYGAQEALTPAATGNLVSFKA